MVADHRTRLTGRLIRTSFEVSGSVPHQGQAGARFLAATTVHEVFAKTASATLQRPYSLSGTAHSGVVDDGRQHSYMSSSALQKQAATLQATLDTDRAAVAAKQGEITTLQGQLPDFQTAVTDANQAVSTKQAELDTLTAQLPALQDAVTAADAKVAAQEQVVSDLEAALPTEEGEQGRRRGPDCRCEGLAGPARHGSGPDQGHRRHHRPGRLRGLTLLRAGSTRRRTANCRRPAPLGIYPHGV